MKTWKKYLVAAVSSAVLAFALISFSLTGVGVHGSAATAFADSTPAVSIPAESLKVVEALQNSFRSISNGLLPSVVEVDVTED